MPKLDLPYKISTLVYFRNEENEILLMQRNKAPNLGLWSPIGGKLEMSTGESPFEAAKRESEEEVGISLKDEDIHLFAMIAEKNYEDRTHWLMFLFDCKRPLNSLPKDISEGSFAFHKEADLMNLDIPDTDRLAIWPIYFKHRTGFVSMRIDCQSGQSPKIITEEILVSSRQTQSV